MTSGWVWSARDVMLLGSSIGSFRVDGLRSIPIFLQVVLLKDHRPQHPPPPSLVLNTGSTLQFVFFLKRQGPNAVLGHWVEQFAPGNRTPSWRSHEFQL